MFEPVRISPTARDGASETGDDRRWALEGFDLRSALARVCDVPPTRIDLPASLDTAGRYDFVVTLAPGQPYEARRRAMRAGIEKHFSVRISDERRAIDVYVMTAPDGPGAALRARFSTLTAMRHAAIGAPVSELNAWSSSIDDLCHVLEGHFGRPVINETGLAGRYDLQIEKFLPDTEAFLATLKDQAGLVVSAARRDVQVLVVRTVWQ